LKVTDTAGQIKNNIDVRQMIWNAWKETVLHNSDSGADQEEDGTQNNEKTVLIFIKVRLNYLTL
jgi:hypothetical protein